MIRQKFIDTFGLLTMLNGKPMCPSCDTRQLQIVTHEDNLSRLKCRHCKEYVGTPTSDPTELFDEVIQYTLMNTLCKSQSQEDAHSVIKKSNFGETEG